MINKLVILVLFVCACANSRAQTNIITTVAGNGNQGYAGDNGPATNAEFYHAWQLCYDNNNVYVSDCFNHRIRKIDLLTGVITTIAGTDSFGYNGDNIQATDARLWVPEGVATDSAGNIYIADGINERIRKVTVSTGIITTIAGNGSAGYSGDGGPATNAEIHYPAGLSSDRQGNLYFCDAGNYAVRKVTPSGIIYTVAGNGTAGYSGDGLAATNAQMEMPNKVTVDNFGNLIISDGQNYVIRKVDAITGIITTMAGNGTAGYSGDGGPASGAILSGPGGGFVDKQNNFYFAEWQSAVIRKIDGTTGIITSVVGCGIQGFAGDGGVATAAEIMPSDVCLDSFGTMYIVDISNNRIRKVYNPKLSVAPYSYSTTEVRIYPNPASNEVIISYDFANGVGGVIQLMDITGRTVLTKPLSAQKKQEEVSIENISPGVYLYNVFQNDMLLSSGKIVKL